MAETVVTKPETRVQPKRIIVCCDGTACSAYKGSQENPYTNVSRISRCIKPVGDDGNPQVVHYIPGIGTDDGNPKNWYNQGVGKGIDEKIIEAYSFICHNYVTGKDQIILIGFSRGAYIMRCVADFILKVGLLTKRGLHYLYPLYEKWSNEVFDEVSGRSSGVERNPEQNMGDSRNTSKDRAKRAGASVDHDVEMSANDGDFCQKILANSELLRSKIQIQVCAVWDTVSSLGIPRAGVFAPRPMDKLNFVHSDLSDGIDHAFQALALHEHRQPFLPIVWKLPKTAEETRNGKSRLQQCWFMGYHGDVGGGNKVESLAQFALVWMISRLDDFIDFDWDNFWNPRSNGSGWKVSDWKVNGAPSQKLVEFGETSDQSQNPRLRPHQEPFTAKVRVPESMTPLYWLSGSTCREPRRQFWTGERYEDDHTPSNDISKEYIHFTVRLIRELKALEPCKVLKEVTPLLERGSWIWNIRIIQQATWWERLQRKRAPAPVAYSISEGETDDVELNLLLMWLESELRVLQREAKEGDVPPKSIVADLQDWIWEARDPVRRAK